MYVQATRDPGADSIAQLAGLARKHDSQPQGLQPLVNYRALSALPLLEGVDCRTDPLQQGHRLPIAARAVSPPPIAVVVVAGVAPDAQDVQVVPRRIAQAARGVPIVDQLLEPGGCVTLGCTIHGLQPAHRGIEAVAHVALQTLVRATFAHAAHLL